MLIALDQESKRMRLCVEVAHLPHADQCQVHSLLGKRRKAAIPFPVLSFPAPDSIFPSTILSYIAYVEAQFHPLFPAAHGLFPFEVRKCVHWLYHELILCLHNAGYFELHRYLQRRYYNALTLEEEFIVEFKEFLMLGNGKKQAELPAFPIFSCNFDYLKALFGILEKQIAAFEAIYVNYIDFLDQALYETEVASEPEEALTAPHCYTPPQLPSFLIDKSADLDVDVLFPDEYTFRNRDLAMELKEIRKQRPDLQAASDEFREKLICKRAIRTWKEGTYVKIRHRNAVAESFHAAKCLRKTFCRWKMSGERSENEKIAVDFYRKTLSSRTLREWRKAWNRKRREQRIFKQISIKKRISTISCYFLHWQASTRAKSPSSPTNSILRQCDELLGRISTVEQTYVSKLGKILPKPRSARRRLSLSKQQTKLHREVKEMARGKLKG